VKQFEFTGWQDEHDVPDTAHSLLTMLTAIQRWQPHVTSSKPVLVHSGCVYIIGVIVFCAP